MRIAPESPAAHAGLLPGDLLLKLDGDLIADQIELRNREAALAPGTKIRLEGLRGNLPFALDLELGEGPAPSTTGAGGGNGEWGMENGSSGAEAWAPGARRSPGRWMAARLPCALTIPYSPFPIPGLKAPSHTGRARLRHA